MTVNHLYPTTRPTLDLNFARQKRLDPRVTFTRGSTATYVGDDGLIKTAAANEARFDHDPATGESLGLLVEESRTNLVTYSEEFDNAVWLKTAFGTGVSPTVTANNATAPDGTLTADKIDFNRTTATSSDISYIQSNNLSPSAIAYAGSVWVKAATAGDVGKRIQFRHVSSSGTPLIHTLTLNWQRINIVETGVAGTRRLEFGLITAAISDTTVSVHAWGAQVEAGTFPTSYIPTTSSTVTRSVDLASMTGTNFTSWYNQNEGSLFAEWVSPDTTQFSSPAIIKESTAKNGPRIYTYAYTGTKLYSVVKTPSEHVVALTLSYSPNTQLKTVIAYTTSDMASSFNGNTTVATSVTTTIPTMTRLDIGDVYANNARYSNHHIARITYYPTRLTNSQLQELTR